MSIALQPDERVNTFKAIRYGLMHLLPLGAFITGVTPAAIWWFIALTVGRMFFITGGYHRYFSHKTFKMGRIMQFIFALGAQSAAQKGVLWWAAHHRHHHRNSDMLNDIHSPQRGFWWSHLGWSLSDKYEETVIENVPDLAKYPELQWLDKYKFFPAAVLGVTTLVLGGPSALFFGFFLSTVVLWHSTYTINSLSHVIGRRKFATGDTSRNNFVLALLTMGEGWHNNHHHYQSSARQGFEWWQIDLTFYILKALSFTGLIWDLKPVPAAIKGRNLIQNGAVDIGMFRARARELERIIRQGGSEASRNAQVMLENVQKEAEAIASASKSVRNKKLSFTTSK